MARLRKIANARELILQYDKLLKLPSVKISDGIIEIGCGKGNWIIQNAINNPHKMYYGIEKDETIVLKLLKKINCLDPKPKNLFIICDNAINLCNWFHQIEKIYIHFPDPWPKKRHAKRRLMHQTFLKIYYEILKHGGLLEFKTDQENLYKFAIDEIKTLKIFTIVEAKENIYKNNDLSNNHCMTEYESKFLKLNKPIHKIIVKKI